VGWIIRAELTTADTGPASSLLWDLNTTGIAELAPDHGSGAVELIAGFDSEAEAEAAVAALSAPETISPLAVAASVERTDPTAWIDVTRRGSIVVGGRQHAFEVGAAFGHGAHPTTMLALSLLANVIEPGAAMLDFGTGTGVLALAGLASGAGRVVAVDNDPAALTVARDNLAVEPEPAAPTSDRTVVLERLPSQSEQPAGFDVIVANVLLPVHIDQGPSLVDLLGPEGSLVATGALVDQEASLRAAYEPLVPRHHLVDGNWLALQLGHRAPAAS